MLSGDLPVRASSNHARRRHRVLARPRRSLGHLVFAIATTAYIYGRIFFEERDLMTLRGEDYRAYRHQMPKLFPIGSGNQL
jgi:hypothetical protein